jgi:ParB family chromosome partitioning protein
MVLKNRPVRPIPISEIDEGAAHIRKQMNPERLEELKDSIKMLGLLQPITVVEKARRTPSGKKYSLVIGSRRLRACTELGWSHIDAVVIPGTEKIAPLAMSLAENMFRVPLSPRETMDAVSDLYDLYRSDVKAIAKATGMWPETVRRYLNLKKYGTKKILKWIRKGKISLYDAKRAIEAAQWNITKGEKILERMVKEKMTLPEKRRLVDIIDEKPEIPVNVAVRKTQEVRIEWRLSVRLTQKEREALESASRNMQTSPEEAAAQVLREWLKEEGYI